MYSIKEFVLDMLDGGVIGWFVLALISVLLILLLWGLFIAVDSIGISTRTYHVQAVTKNHTPAYTTVTMVSNGNGGSTPIITNHPESWYATVIFNNHMLGCSISQQTYNELQLPQEVVASIGQGRLSGNSYCTGIQL